MIARPDWLSDTPAVLAHRGGAALGAENSIDALHRSERGGADAVEIDVQEIARGDLVLFHDAYVAVEDRWHWIRELDRQELETLAGPVVGFDDLLDRMADTTLGLYVEVKAVSRAGLWRLIESVVGRGLLGRTVIGSFRHDVAALVADDGRLPGSVLYRDRFIDPIALARYLGCSILHPCFDEGEWMIDLMRGTWMERVHRAGVSVVGWNTNDPAIMERMVEAGFDVICTDDPRLWSRPA